MPTQIFLSFQDLPWHPTGWQTWALPAHPSCCLLLNWFLIPLISSTSKPSGAGRAGFIQGCRAFLLSYIPSEECGRAGSCGAWKPHVWPSFVRLSCQVRNQSPASQGRCCFTLVPGLVQTLGEHPSSASAGRHCVPF